MAAACSAVPASDGASAAGPVQRGAVERAAEGAHAPAALIHAAAVAGAASAQQLAVLGQRRRELGWVEPAPGGGGQHWPVGVCGVTGVQAGSGREVGGCTAGPAWPAMGAWLPARAAVESDLLPARPQHSGKKAGSVPGAPAAHLAASRSLVPGHEPRREPGFGLFREERPEFASGPRWPSRTLEERSRVGSGPKRSTRAGKIACRYCTGPTSAAAFHSPTDTTVRLSSLPITPAYYQAGNTKDHTCCSWSFWQPPPGLVPSLKAIRL